MDLNLEFLSKKVVTLLALIMAHRMQTLSLIYIDNIKIVSETNIIKITGRIKTSGLNKVQPLLRIPLFHDNCKVCAASALESYLQRTKILHKNIKKLFVSIKTLHKAVELQTLNRWVSNTLSLAGIDSDVFSVHSTRHASISAAKKRGVSFDIIKNTAGWSKSSQTFANFYNLEIVEDRNSFGRVIYNVNNNQEADN